jgi:exosortase
LATFDAWGDIYRIAMRDEEASHILLVPIAVAWLVWEHRRGLRECGRSNLWVGPLTVLIGAGLYVYGAAGWERTITYLGAVVLAIGCLLSVVGMQVFWRFWPAFVALLFLVPVPGVLRQQIAGPLGTWTAKVSEQLLVLLGLPVERAGNLLSINHVDVTIAEACNGLRMVMSLFFVSYVVAFERRVSWFLRVVILVGAPISAMACNVIRLIPTLYLYGYASRETAEAFHDAAGWVMLGVAYFGLVGLIRLVGWIAAGEAESVRGESR